MGRGVWMGQFAFGRGLFAISRNWPSPGRSGGPQDIKASETQKVGSIILLSLIQKLIPLCVELIDGEIYIFTSSSCKQKLALLSRHLCLLIHLIIIHIIIQVAQGCGRNHADDVRPTGFRQQRWRRGRGSAAVSGQVLWQALGQQCCPCRLASSRPQCSRICRGVRKEQPAGWDPTEEVASACLGPLPSSPGLVPAVRGPWAVAGGVELQVHVQGGAWASNKLCRAPSLAPFTAASVSFLHRGRGCTNYARL